MVNPIYLTNIAVCLGSTIDLGVKRITGNWDVYLQNNPTPGKTTLPWNPHEVDFIGVGNQKFVLEGHFLEGSITNNAGSVRMQMAYLGSFCNMGSPSWMKWQTNYLMNGLASICVLPIDPKFSMNFDNEDEVDYSLTLLETKPW